MLSYRRWTDAKELVLKASANHQRVAEYARQAGMVWRQASTFPSPDRLITPRAAAQLLLWYCSDLDPWEDVRGEVER